MTAKKNRDKNGREAQDLDRVLESFPFANVVEHNLALFQEVLDSAFAQKRDFFVHEISSRLKKSFKSLNDATEQEGMEFDWMGIESLSRLRSLVGGRFQNLRKRWIEAGFPLREHRGDKGTEYSVSEKGWIELSNWILKQGYESRLNADSPDFLFELRKVKS